MEKKRNRGKKSRASLRHLTDRFILEHEKPAIISELNHASDRGAALIGAAILDNALMLGLTEKLCFDDEDHHKRIFYSEGGPLSSFSQRIAMARCLAIISVRIEKCCNAVRNIRNAFAHSPIAIDFKNELIVDTCKVFPELSNGTKAFEATGVKDENRIRYSVSCVYTNLRAF